MSSTDINKLSWDLISAWFADNDLVAVAKDLSSLKIADETAEAFSELMEYQGFDVKKVLKAMMANAAKSNVKDRKVEFTTSAGAPFKYDGDKKLMEDVSILVFLFCSRGSNWEGIRRKSNEELIGVMDILKQKYSIHTVSAVSSKSLSPTTVTLPRIAACFPAMVVELHIRGQAKAMFQLADLGIYPTYMDSSKAVHNTPTSARAFLTTAIACMIPKKKFVGLMRLAMLSAVLLDEVIHAKDKKFTKCQDILQYLLASNNTPAVPVAARIPFLESYGIARKTEGATSYSYPGWVRAATDAAQVRIMELRPEDGGVLIDFLKTF